MQSNNRYNRVFVTLAVLAAVSALVGTQPCPFAKAAQAAEEVHVPLSLQEIAAADRQMIVEKDVSIPMRDGLRLKADIFRPSNQGRYPVIMSMGVYQKDMEYWPGPLATQSKYSNFEQLTPEDYIPHGYVLVRIDTRGAGRSPGFLQVFNNDQEGRDYYDAIEWAAQQPWSSGSVGISGTSYLGMNQWAAAALHPPHLKAMVTWEALIDNYRQGTYPGGIYREAFQNWYADRMEDHLLRWQARDDGANQAVGAENAVFLAMQHRLDDEFWKVRSNGPEKLRTITTPTLTVSAWPNWGGVGHLKGSTEAYRYLGSTQKRMEIFSSQFSENTIRFYSKEGTQQQLRWYDHYLKAVDNGVEREAPVRLAMRRSDRPEDFIWREERDWPIPNTKYMKYYLSNDQMLSLAQPTRAGAVTYKRGALDSILTTAGAQEGASSFTGASPDQTGITFTTEPFTEDTQLAGYLELHTRLASTLKDTDVHVSVWIVHPDGKEEVVTRGWLKASHRKLDPAMSTPWAPYHTHDEEEYLTPGRPVTLDVAVWPTTMDFIAGSRLKLRIAPCSPGFYSCTRAASGGIDTVFTGGPDPAYLILPVVPQRDAQPSARGG